MSLKLSLFENVIDSLNEALRKYKEGQDGDENAYKFCVQNLCHFLELLLKYQVTRSHNLLIYRHPFKKINPDSVTIGIWEAIQFLENDGKKISPDFHSDLEWLKKLRNNIEHYQFEMQLPEVNDTVGRLINSALLFGYEHQLELSKHIDQEFLELAEVYKARLAVAITKVEESEEIAFRGLRHKEFWDVRFGPFACNNCGHLTLIPNDDSHTGYRCEFCNEVEGDEMEVGCDICGASTEYGEMEFWTTDRDTIEMRCPMCTMAYKKGRDD